jgi:regulator of sirC expression with transglutaminase-like and TPR domain
MEVPDTPARSHFASLIARPVIPLAEAALAIAGEEYRGLDIGAHLRTIDGLGSRVAARLLPPPRPALQVLAALKSVLFEEERFRGNEAEYYDPRNSFLNEVLGRKLGIPITLCLLYIEVAGRAGLPLQGVGFPGHFLVRCPAGEGMAEDLFVDPFNGGDLLTGEECVARFRALLHGREFDPKFLEPVTPVQILSRMLHNLKKIYVEAGDDVRALWVIDRLILLSPGNLEERRDRGLVSARLGGTASAVKDLSDYLAASPQAADAEEVAQLLSELKVRKGLLN